MTALSVKDDITRALLAGVSLFLVVLAGAYAVKTTLVSGDAAGGVLVEAPETVVIAPREITYRAPGEYFRGGYEVDGPMRTVSVTRPLTIMKHQVSHADYERCVAVGVCPRAEPEFAVTGGADVPATGISFQDTQAYAAWLSRQTGETWRLPTDQEFALAAGSRFPDDALGATRNPADRWLASYRRDAARSANRDAVPKPAGHFGENEFGLADFGGNVWEWTSTCRQRVDLDRGETETDGPGSCGIYMAAGQHRAAMVFFVRNPKGGGCAVGAPPDNLGFRLVKEPGWSARLLMAARERGLPL